MTSITDIQAFWPTFYAMIAALCGGLGWAIKRRDKTREDDKKEEQERDKRQAQLEDSRQRREASRESVLNQQFDKLLARLTDDLRSSSEKFEALHRKFDESCQEVEKLRDEIERLRTENIGYRQQIEELRKEIEKLRLKMPK